MKPVRPFSRNLALLLLAALPALAEAQPANGCGDLANAFGPLDFRHDQDKIGIVTGNHFTPKVEALISGANGYLGGDIDYTLRAIPNHPGALLAVTRYAERTRRDPAPDTRYTVECYYDRALRFRPDDTTVRMLFATYLGKNGRTPEAERQLARVEVLAKDNGFTHYNAGLVYLEMKNYLKAVQQAHVAAALGFGRTELRDALKAAGQWKEPDPDVPPPASAASAEEPSTTAAPRP